MKKIVMALLLTFTGISAQAADFVISVQSAGSLKWVVKYNNVVIGTETKDKSLNSFYSTSSGVRLPVNASANKLAINGDQVWFESSNCTGPVYIAALYPTFMTHRGVMYKPTVTSAVAKTMHSRLSNYEGEPCSEIEQTLGTAYPVQVCSSQDCPFTSNSDIVFEQQ